MFPQRHYNSACSLKLGANPATRLDNITFGQNIIHLLRPQYWVISLTMQCSFAHFASLLKISLMSMLLAPVTAFPHGGVVLEEDICLIKVGFYQAHFTVFQPESRQHEQFCEDLPDIGESIFVLEYLHDLSLIHI